MMVKLVVLEGWVKRLLKTTENDVVEAEVFMQSPYMSGGRIEGTDVVAFFVGSKGPEDSCFYLIRFSDVGRLLKYDVIRFGEYLSTEALEQYQGMDTEEMWDKLKNRILEDWQKDGW